MEAMSTSVEARPTSVEAMSTSTKRSPLRFHPFQSAFQGFRPVAIRGVPPRSSTAPLSPPRHPTVSGDLEANPAEEQVRPCVRRRRVQVSQPSPMAEFTLLVRPRVREHARISTGSTRFPNRFRDKNGQFSFTIGFAHVASHHLSPPARSRRHERRRLRTRAPRPIRSHSGPLWIRSPPARLIKRSPAPAKAATRACRPASTTALDTGSASAIRASVRRYPIPPAPAKAAKKARRSA